MIARAELPPPAATEEDVELRKLRHALAGDHQVVPVSNEHIGKVRETEGRIYVEGNASWLGVRPHSRCGHCQGEGKELYRGREKIPCRCVLKAAGLPRRRFVTRFPTLKLPRRPNESRTEMRGRLHKAAKKAARAGASG